jgi:hypothetical protein
VVFRCKPFGQRRVRLVGKEEWTRYLVEVGLGEGSLLGGRLDIGLLVDIWVWLMIEVAC